MDVLEGMRVWLSEPAVEALFVKVFMEVAAGFAAGEIADGFAYAAACREMVDDVSVCEFRNEVELWFDKMVEELAAIFAA